MPYGRRVTKSVKSLTIEFNDGEIVRWDFPAEALGFYREEPNRAAPSGHVVPDVTWQAHEVRWQSEKRVLTKEDKRNFSKAMDAG